MTKPDGKSAMALRLYLDNIAGTHYQKPNNDFTMLPDNRGQRKHRRSVFLMMGWKGKPEKDSTLPSRKKYGKNTGIAHS